MQLPPFLVEVEPGEIRLPGSRIGLYTIVREYRSGSNAALLAHLYSTLPLDLIKKVIDFYLANRVEVDEYVRQYQTELDRQFAEGHHLASEELQVRLAIAAQGSSTGD